jgi:ABC-type dipeptide/oligopeptide/nickel transport system ATPase component
LINFEKISVKNGNQTLVDISFELHGSMAIVGESGSGKSLTLKSIMGILPKELDSEMKISGVENLQRGVNLSLVPQNPFTALSPMSKIKKQFWGADKDDARVLLAQTGLDASCMDRFPSELSGGQLQRVIIAIALSQKPKLLLMDEPTTALDTDTKQEIVGLIKELRHELGFYLIFVTHELFLARELCEQIMVIQNGKTVELSSKEEIFEAPKAEYTKKLLEADFNGREFRK